MAEKVTDIATAKDAGAEPTVNDTKVQKLAVDYKRLKGTMDTARSELGTKMQDAEKTWNCNRLVFKLAVKLKSMEPDTAQANLRVLLRYCEALGVVDQGELFESPLPAQPASATG